MNNQFLRRRIIGCVLTVEILLPNKCPLCSVGFKWICLNVVMELVILVNQAAYHLVTIAKQKHFHN